MGCALQQTLKLDNPFDMKLRRAKDFIESAQLMARRRRGVMSAIWSPSGAKQT